MNLGGQLLILEMQRNGEFSVIDVLEAKYETDADSGKRNVGVHAGKEMAHERTGNDDRSNRVGEGRESRGREGVGDFAHCTDSEGSGKGRAADASVKTKFSQELGTEGSKLTTEERKANNKAALDYFGRTYKWNETGYVLLDGSKLDFSGKHEGGPGGYRTVDHRDIRDALGDDYGGDDYSGSMVQFMSEGNIRISPESGGINLSVKPTKAQMDSLSDFISRNRGEVILDIDNVNGDTLSSTEYPRGTHANKVIRAVKLLLKYLVDESDKIC